MINKTLPRNALPSFFKDVEIVGSAQDDFLKYQLDNQSNVLKDTKDEIVLGIQNTPRLVTSDRVKSLYVNNDFKAIQNLQKEAQKDIDPIHENIKLHKEKAWTRVRGKDGKEFYLSYSKKGSMWVFPEEMHRLTDADGNVTYQCVMQIGSYTATGNIVGIHSYNFSYKSILPIMAIALIVAVALAAILFQGLAFAITALSLVLATAASALGFASFSFTIGPVGLFVLAATVIFIIVFIGLMALWNFINRKYTIRLQVYNWDKNYDWKIVDDFKSNSVTPSTKDPILIDIPKFDPDVIYPPGFEPIEPIDQICHYAVIIWENDNTFLEGCSMALRFKRGDNPNYGFMWAFSCPRFKDNQQAATNQLTTAKNYREKEVKWNKDPLGFKIYAGNDQSSNIKFGLSALSGADDNLYTININICPP
ncbi:hypothetical protein I5515_04590 [Acinetobacter calcoaceticus]|uniref:hypothetical protein n=1 Tax=Acinetobacter calcoaceticus TaxID=471 RepID=UPI0018FF19DD|nr:hypothetical protein [Acinetobacter calcoaceticus]MBJ9721072.1 hypothetical protein [Acinetobacter calcoaceticus]